jgi:hypothetical protein
MKKRFGMKKIIIREQNKKNVMTIKTKVIANFIFIS